MSEIKLFENQQVRTAWDTEQEKWYVSIVDVIAILTGSPNPQVYWRVMKKRLREEGNETVTNCNGLKMLAEASTKDISQATNPKNFEESKKVAKQGGDIAGNARKELEEKTKKKVITPLNAIDFLGNKNKLK
jgi:hypothetical protein